MTRKGVDLTTELSPFVPADGPSPAELVALRTWLPTRRWFPVKSGLTSIEPWLSVRFDDGSDTVIHILRAYGSGGSSVPADVDSAPSGPHALVHVPVVRRAIPEELRTTPDGDVHDLGSSPDLPRGLIAQIDGDWLLDGFFEPAYWQSWLTLAQWGEADDGAREPLDVTGAVFIAGEQSNSSVIFPQITGGAILKVFRGLAKGPNPDVDVPRALIQAGWDGVPRPLAWLELTWAEHDTGLLDLGVLSEFIADSSDGFELACAFAAQGHSFATEAQRLGGTVAQMHTALSRALPTDLTVSLEWLRTELRRRARQAIASSPILAGRAGAIEALLGQLDDPGGRASLILQHIHGDLHLGQALYAGDTGWRILDFEGEPMRPVEERVRPDLPIRDVAGVLRSFDYAAAVGESTDAGWVLDAREAFLRGYRESAPPAADPTLEATILLALELDKALYEVGYESANRPDWVSIPLTGIDRILAGEYD